MSKSGAVTWLSVATLVFVLAHTHEDALFAGEPALDRYLLGAAPLGLLLAVHLVGLVLARSGQSLGFGLTAVAAAIWAGFFGFVHLAEALTFNWRYGVFSSVVVLGAIVLGLVLALLAGWLSVRPETRE